MVPWYESKDAKLLRVSRDDLERIFEIGEDRLIDSGLYMQIVTRPGFLGMEWVESAHPMWTTRPSD